MMSSNRPFSGPPTSTVASTRKARTAPPAADEAEAHFLAPLARMVCAAYFA